MSAETGHSRSDGHGAAEGDADPQTTPLRPGQATERVIPHRYHGTDPLSPGQPGNGTISRPCLGRITSTSLQRLLAPHLPLLLSPAGKVCKFIKCFSTQLRREVLLLPPSHKQVSGLYPLWSWNSSGTETGQPVPLPRCPHEGIKKVFLPHSHSARP